MMTRVRHPVQSHGQKGNQSAPVRSTSYRLGGRRTEAPPPQADPLQRPQVRRAPLKPLVMATAPLAVVDQDTLFVIVDLLNGGRIPDGTAEKWRGLKNIRERSKLSLK